MAINPSFGVTYSYVDRSGEPSSFSIPVAEADFIEGDANADENAFAIATVALVDGQLTRKNFTETVRVSNVAHSTTGQREQKFLVTYEDNITKALYRFEIPTRKVTLEPPVNTDEYDITAPPFAAWVTAAEAYVVSPDGNSVVIRSIRLMGKNT